jgi:hypothetical protein
MIRQQKVVFGYSFLNNREWNLFEIVHIIIFDVARPNQNDSIYLRRRPPPHTHLGALMGASSVFHTGENCNVKQFLICANWSEKSVIIWSCLDTPAGLDLELLSNSRSSHKLTLAI